METPPNTTEASTTHTGHRGWRVPLPRLSLSERRLLLALVDLLVLNIALLTTLALRFDYAFSLRTLTEAWGYFLLLSALWFLWSSFFDCYDLPATADASHSAWRTGRAGVLTALSYLTVPVYSPPFLHSRLTAVLFVGLVTLSVPLWRLIYAAVFVQPAFQRRVLIVGAGRSGSELARVLAATPQQGNPYAGSGYVAVGLVDDDPAKLGTHVEGVPVLGNRSDLPRLVGRHRVDMVVLAITHAAEVHPELLKGLLDARELGLPLIPMSELYEQVTGRVPVNHAGGNLHVVLPLGDSATGRVFGVGKRLFDLLAAVVGLLIVALISPFVALSNAFSSPGPLFYRQTRVGRRGNYFQVVKFRSMIPQAEASSGAVWAAKHDPRITPAGRFLRRTRLDELPQFYNVLRGEMSLVGPRPDVPAQRALYSDADWAQRCSVRPGITGLAQALYRSESTEAQRLAADLRYTHEASCWLDLKILLLTCKRLSGKGGN